jgi:hypothetical protein
MSSCYGLQWEEVLVFGQNGHEDAMNEAVDSAESVDS